LEASLWKMASARKAARHVIKNQEHDAAVKKLRSGDQELADKFAPTLQDQIDLERERLKMAVQKEGGILKELDETKRLLGANALRQVEGNEQVQSIRREAKFIQGLKAVMKESKMRDAKINTIPGEPAYNGQFKLITRKEPCEAEKNTVWKNGKCVVGGEEEAPDTAQEMSASSQVEESQEDVDKAFTDYNHKKAAYERAHDGAYKAKRRWEVLKQELDAKKKPSDQKRQEVEDAEAESEKLTKVSEAKLEELQKARAAKDAAKKRHHDALADLLKAQADEEHVDDDNIELTDKRERAFEDRILKDKDEEAAVEEDEAKLVEKHSDELRDRARGLENSAQSSVGSEAGSYKMWGHDAEEEAKALHDRNNEEVVRLHGVQREDSLSTSERYRQTLNDAATNGGGAEVLRPTSLSTADEQDLTADHTKLDGLLRDEKGSEEKVHDSLESRSELQEHKNMVGLRKSHTLNLMTRAENSSMETAVLCAAVASWHSPGRHRRLGRRWISSGARKATATLGRFL